MEDETRALRRTIIKPVSYRDLSLQFKLIFWIGLMLCCITGHAQTSDVPSVLRAQTPDGLVLLLPNAQLPAETLVSIDGVRLTISTEADFRVYRATYKGQAHELFVARDGRPKWLAFDPGKERFRHVLPSLRVELRDYDRLDEVVEAAGGIAGQAYESLDFAIVRLPPDMNPAEAASSIRALAGVKQASIQFRGPLRVPM